MIKNKPLENYNKSELSELVKIIKSNLKGQITSDNFQLKIKHLQANANNLIQTSGITPQIMNNISLVENHMESIIIHDHTFNTSIMVNEIWNVLHGKVVENKINYIDKFARQ